MKNVVDGRSAKRRPGAKHAAPRLWLRLGKVSRRGKQAVSVKLDGRFGLCNL